jgi:hypothetical protein
LNEKVLCNSFQEYFESIKSIWNKLENPNRVIPFCTPLFHNPKFLIIGTNHSNNFDPYDEEENNRIADSFSKKIPEENTFLKHHHPFAKGLDRVVSSVNQDYKDLKISEEWIGTNRCAIQTNSAGLGSEIKNHPSYKASQEKMDKLLKSFINFIEPKNVILTGMYACELYYPGKKLKDMNSKKVLFKKGSNKTFNLIPVEHLSLNYNTQKVINRLKSAIEEGYCDL